MVSSKLNKKTIFIQLFLGSMVFVNLVSCGDVKLNVSGDENNIGETLTEVSALTTYEGNDTQQVAIYDELTQGIHRFDLSTNEHRGFSRVSQPGLKHYVISHPNGNYIIDLTTKGLSIILKSGETIENPIVFQGTPKSAAFRPELGLLVIYDNLMTLMALKLDPNGRVIGTWLSGSLNSGSQILAGDLDEQGRLVLAMSDSSIAVLDIDQAIRDGTQSSTWPELGLPRFSTQIVDINWVASIKGTTRVLLRSTTTLVLYDYLLKTIVATQDLSSYQAIKLSRRTDPHILVSTTSANQKLLFFAQGDRIESRSLIRVIEIAMASFLDISGNKWSFVSSKGRYQYFYNDVNMVLTNRELRVYRLSDMLALRSDNLPDKGIVALANQFSFSLFPSELGYAEKREFTTNQVVPFRRFNLPYIQK